jgi:soluble lytic murein transglycosylase
MNPRPVATLRVRATVAGLTLLMTPGLALADTELPSIGPLPFERPYASASAAAIDATIATGAIAGQAAATAAIKAGKLATGGPVAQLKGGLDALASGNVARARVVRDNLPANSLDRHILMWAIATSGADAVASGEIAEAAYALSGWPGMARLRTNSEKAMYRENPGPRTVLSAFGSSQPQTIEGAILLARAHLATGNTAQARAALARFWRTEKLDAKEEQAIIREFGKVIPAADHRFRMERMLYADRISSAERVAGLAGGGALVKAFAAVTRNEKNAKSLMAAVPKAQRGAAWTFAESRRLRRAEKHREAAAVMLKAPKDAASLVDPDAWWVERRVLSRELLDLGDAKTAYQLAAAHAAESPTLAVDAEFHAGWYAFRGVGDARTGARHFARIAEIADGPISLSRA